MRVAGVDIGTNTILMVIADIEQDGSLTIISDHHAIARLGKNVDADKNINPDAIERAVTILRGYKEICTKEKVHLVNAVATSAVRSANNSSEVLPKLSDALGVSITSISGYLEAELTFAGTVLNDSETTVIDIGGGSTEIITGLNRTIQHRVSIEIGAVRVTERFWLSTNQELSYLNEAIEYIYQQLHTIDLPISENVIAVAGTPTTLAQMILKDDTFNADVIHNFVLTNEMIATCIETITSTQPEKRGTISGVNPARADILLAGALILQQFMKINSLAQITVSTKGLRYGLLTFVPISLYK